MNEYMTKQKSNVGMSLTSFLQFDLKTYNSHLNLCCFLPFHLTAEGYGFAAYGAADSSGGSGYGGGGSGGWGLGSNTILIDLDMIFDISRWNRLTRM